MSASADTTLDHEAEPTSRTGFVVADLMVPVLAVLAVTGAAVGRPELTALGAVVIVTTVLARAWTRVALDDLDYRCYASQPRAVEGDELRITLVVENRKPVPVPWLRVHEILPAGLELVDTPEARSPFTQATDLEVTLGLGGYERVRRRYRVRAVRRGDWTLGPVRLRAGDPFGFYESLRVRLRSSTSLVVYPATVPVPDQSLRLPSPSGDGARDPWKREDPTLPLALRVYRRGDPLRAIDWKATARRGEHVVRTYQTAAVRAMAIVLDCHSAVSWPWSDSPTVLEACVRATASLASAALTDRQEVGLICNGVPVGGRAEAVLAPGTGDEQLVRVMEALARTQSVVLRGLTEMIDGAGANALPDRAAIVWVCGTWRDELDRLVRVAQARGHPCRVIYAGRDAPPSPPGIVVEDWRSYVGMDEP